MGEAKRKLMRLALDELHPAVRSGVRQATPDAAWLIVEPVEGSRSGVAMGGEQFTTFEHDGVACRMAVAVFMREGELYARCIVHQPAFRCEWYVIRGTAPAVPPTL